MPELTEVHIALLVAVLLAGFILGWIFRGRRTHREKKSINAGWQAQLDSQQSEHGRLAQQNKSLMEQISQYQASNKDAKTRTRELSDSLKEAFERRDELQRQLKDIRGNLEIAIAQRDKLQSTASTVTDNEEKLARQLIERDEKVARLRKELSGWQQRVPPLVERYRQRDLEAQQLEVELQKATDRIASLESVSTGEETRIEPVDSSKLPDGMDASNEPHTETSILSGTAMDDDYDEAANSDDAADSAPLDEARELHADVETCDVERDESATSSDDDLPNALDGNRATDIDAQDNLKKIKGIGPAIEKTLNDLGFFRYDQIAEMSEYEIDRVASELKGFRSRIYREDWIGQARLLQQQKTGY